MGLWVFAFSSSSSTTTASSSTSSSSSLFAHSAVLALRNPAEGAVMSAVPLGSLQ